MRLLYVYVTADWHALLSVHRRRPSGAGHPVSVRQFAGAAAACRQPVPGNLQPAVRTDAHQPRPRRSVHRRRLADVGYSSCFPDAANAHYPLQRRLYRLHEQHG